MKKLILKLFGIDLDFFEEVKKYNALKQRENDIAEFKALEKQIVAVINLHKGDVLYLLRHYSESGFPVKRYKELSDKYRLYDDQIYKNL